MKQTSDLENLLEPLIINLGYELWGIEYLPQAKHSVLRIFIDSPRGIALQDCERVSREVSATLDVEDPVSGFYNLEISSPGIPRPLFKPSHFMRYLGLHVQLKLRTPIAGKRHMNALIVSATEDDVLLEVEQEQFRVQYSQILKAIVNM
jgi:ribosome maturation factor RimP